jgi:hypothetical protein
MVEFVPLLLAGEVELGELRHEDSFDEGFEN